MLPGVAHNPVLPYVCRYTQRTSTLAKRLDDEWYSPSDVQEVSAGPPVIP